LHLVRRISPKVSSVPLLAIDCENDPLSGRFLHAHLYSEDPPTDLHFTDIDLLESWLMSQHKKGTHHKTPPFVLIGFNFRYDSPFITRIVDDLKTLWAEGRFISGRLKNGIKMLDLMNHIDSGQSLANWIEYLDMEKRFGVKKLSLRELEKRNRFDAMATWYMGDSIQRFYVEELKIPLKLTIGSCALTLFLSRFFDHCWKRSDDQQWLNDYERVALRGGRTECFQRGRIRHVSYDVNSTYLSIMRDHDFPDPISACYVGSNKDFESNFAKYDSIVDCVVEAPKSKIMVLPYYDPTLKKLTFPCGTFAGRWSSPELKIALENGYKILAVKSYIYYTRSFPYFRSFAEFVWSKRAEYQGKGNIGMDKLIKKIGNTCYGKFGQANDTGGYWGKLDDYDVDIDQSVVRVQKIGGIEYISVPSGNKVDSLHTFPVIPVFVAAYARVKLFLAMKKNEEGVVYCDTDSIKSRLPVKGISLGKDLGEWAFEGIFEHVFYKSKWYGDKLKGVPKRAKQVSDSRDFAEFLYDKPVGFKEAIRKGELWNVWKALPKRVSKIDDKRIWSGRLSDPLQMCYNDLEVRK